MSKPSVAPAAFQLIGIVASPGQDDVVASAASDRVIAVAGIDVVIATAAGDRRCMAVSPTMISLRATAVDMVPRRRG